jgi:hypothetical protein
LAGGLFGTTRFVDSGKLSLPGPMTGAGKHDFRALIKNMEATPTLSQSA